MWKFKRNRKQVPKYLKQNNAPSGKPSVPVKQASSGKMSPEDLNKVQKNITRQAILAGLTVVLTIVILFAMTSAWYTNIVQTSGLVFEAESWGFDGEIKAGSEDPILASPGDGGVVHLEVQNTSQNVSAISVNVSKTGMLEEMQQRLFLYVDTHMSRDEETMDRVYLNSQESYTYTVFANGNLTLTENVSNAPQLKWHWVYDVLGYYVLAQSTEVQGEDVTRVQEYLRPIEYDYDEATTVLKGGPMSYVVEEETEETDESEENSEAAEAAETGEETETGGETGTGENTETEGSEESITMELTTVDGTRSPEAFLRELSKTDGYAGTIDTTKVTDDGYYPVAVDENGYGVYAYLCNYAEIQRATEFDTYLGELAYKKKVDPDSVKDVDEKLFQFAVTLNISAQKNESKAVNVNRLDTLQDVITQKTADEIQLSDDISIPAGQSLVIPENTRVMLDLNGKTIHCASDKAIDGKPGSSLTIINGEITGPGSETKTYGVYTTGSEVVMSNVKVNNFQYGVFLGDHVKDNPMDSRVHMVDCTVDAGYYAVFVNGNGTQSTQKTQMLIERCTLTSGGMVLTSNGSADRAGTDIQIIDSTLTAYPADKETGARGHGIYHPQKDSTMRIVNSTVSGYSGVVIKGGHVSIENSQIEGTGAYQEAKLSTSGFTDTGDAVYVETGFGYDIQLEISGDKTTLSHEAKESKSLQVVSADATNVTIRIYGGTFEEAPPDEYIAEGSIRNGAVVSVQEN